MTFEDYPDTSSTSPSSLDEEKVLKSSRDNSNVSKCATKKSTVRRRNSLSSQYAESVATTAISSSKASSNQTSSTGNVWDRLLRPKKAALWEGYGKDVYDHYDNQDDDDISVLSDFEEEPRCAKSCLSAFCDCMNVMGHEWRHFFITSVKHPLVFVGSLAVFSVVFGVGFVAVKSQRDASIGRNQNTACWIATETADWFQTQFEALMKPLYSIQQGVIHSGYFDHLFAEIGPYPNHVIPESEKVYRNVTGICDDEDLQEKFRSIVEPINKAENLDGVIVGYRLYPANVMCLAEPMVNTKDFPPGIALDHRKMVGYDPGHDSSKFWADTVINLFVDKNPNANVYGPFSNKVLPEGFCGHLAIWSKPSNPTILNVQGHQVENAWGFVMNFVDWQKLKDRSNIYDRFAKSDLEFCLTKTDGPDKDGKMTVKTIAESPKCSSLNDDNSIVVSVDTLNGKWDNRVGTLKGWEPVWYPWSVAFVALCATLSALLAQGVLVQRLLHKKLLYKMMPKGAIAKLQRGQTVVEKYDLVTIFFSDIVGFTSMAGELRPIQVMRMLNELYIQFDKLVKKHDVYKVETIGDAYMVVGGAPNRRPSPDAAERVALFALEAMAFVKDFRTKNGDQIFIRAGLASGPVVSGVVGDAMPRYCFFGDTVNFASRMESTSVKMKIQCSDLTARLLQDAPRHAFELEERREGDNVGVEVKGKGLTHTWWIKKATARTNKPKETIDYVPDIETSISEVQCTLESPCIEQVSDFHDDSNPKFRPALRRCSLMSHDWALLGCDNVGLTNIVEKNSVLIDRIAYIIGNYADFCSQSYGGNRVLGPIPKSQLREFVSAIEKTYNNNHFHSFLHAYHVVHSMDKLIQVLLRESATKMFSTPLSEMPLIPFALIFGALIHDAGHTGMSNKILVEQKHPLADGHSSDDSIAERMSFMLGIELFFDKRFEEIRNAVVPTDGDKIRFCKILVHSVMSTDITSKSRNQLIKDRYESMVNNTSEVTSDVKIPFPHVQHFEDILKRLDLINTAKENCPDEFLITKDSIKWCTFVEHVMLVSDISHLMQCWDNFVTWNFRLFKELRFCHHRSLCDDPYNGWYKGEIWFFENYVIPLAERFQVFFSSDFGEKSVQNAKQNLETWRKVGQEAGRLMLEGDMNGEEENVTVKKLKELVC